MQRMSPGCSECGNLLEFVSKRQFGTDFHRSPTLLSSVSTLLAVHDRSFGLKRDLCDVTTTSLGCGHGCIESPCSISHGLVASVVLHVVGVKP